MVLRLMCDSGRTSSRGPAQPSSRGRHHGCFPGGPGSVPGGHMQDRGPPEPPTECMLECSQSFYTVIQSYQSGKPCFVHRSVNCRSSISRALDRAWLLAEKKTWERRIYLAFCGGPCRPRARISKTSWQKSIRDMALALPTTCLSGGGRSHLKPHLYSGCSLWSSWESSSIAVLKGRLRQR